jgi:hypothetical protein
MFMAKMNWEKATLTAKIAYQGSIDGRGNKPKNTTSKWKRKLKKKLKRKKVAMQILEKRGPMRYGWNEDKLSSKAHIIIGFGTVCKLENQGPQAMHALDGCGDSIPKERALCSMCSSYLKNRDCQ